MSPKILVIDDSEVTLAWVQQALAPNGYDVLTSNTPLGTHATVFTKKPDLILLDVGMPGLSGDILCKMLKENPRTKGTRVVLYSTLPESELKQLSKQCNADGYIKKTQDVQQLITQIEALFGRKENDAKPNESNQQAPRILVIDDSPLILFWVRQGLSPYGFEVMTCGRPKDVESFVNTTRPELILLDVRMPQQSGDSLCKALKKNKKYKDIPVVLYSEIPETELRKLAKESQADGYIVKSDNVDDLAKTILSILRKKS